MEEGEVMPQPPVDQGLSFEAPEVAAAFSPGPGTPFVIFHSGISGRPEMDPVLTAQRVMSEGPN